MGDSVKPKRPPMKPGAARSHPPLRDPRAEQSSPETNGTAAPHAIALPDPEIRQRRAPYDGPARIAALEMELARLGHARGAEADELASMLVRIAESERAKSAAEERSNALAERVRELEAQCEQSRREMDAMRQQTRRSAEVAEMASRRAGLAEKSAADGAAALERAGAELEADRARATDMEARLTRMKREHLAELSALRNAHDESSAVAARALEEATARASTALEEARAEGEREAKAHASRALEEAGAQAARALEEARGQAARLLEEAGAEAARALDLERSAHAQARHRAAAAETALSGLRGVLTRAAALVDEMERREEMTASLRARALQEARRILSGRSASGSRPTTASEAVPPDMPEKSGT